MDTVIFVAVALAMLRFIAWGVKLFQYVHTGEWQIDQRLRSL